MANYVKVSSLSMKNGVAYQGNSKNGFQNEVDRMLEDWDKRVGIVLPEKPDIIVLPEICDEYMNYTREERRAYCEIRGEQGLNFFKKKAKENNCYIAYSSHFTIEDGTWRNGTIVIDRAGEIAGRYHKNHPTIPDIESGHVKAGKDTPVIQCDFGKVCCAICFDLNFSQLLEKYKKGGRPDIILFSSAYHGGLMQNYWAYYLRSYFIGTIISEQNNIINPVGDIIAHSTNYFGYVSKAINLDYAVVHLDYNWERLRKAKEKYGDGFMVYDPGYVGAVLITCESESMTIRDIIDEFEIELLDEYFERCLKHREWHIE